MNAIRLLSFAALGFSPLGCHPDQTTLAVPTGGDVVGVIVSAATIYITLIAWSRLIGPRSFSQMTAFDFGVTVAIGAIVGGTATGSTPLWGGFLGLAMLFIIRGLIGHFRRHGLNRLVDNRPILVMARDQILDDQLIRAKLTREDVLEALRTSGINRFEQVLAVIVERNGELSVLRRDGDFDEELLAPVDGYEMLR